MVYLAAGLIALVYSWLAAGLRPFTWPMYITVAIPILLALTVIRARPAAENQTRERRGTIVWIGLFLLLCTWELIAYFSSPRHDHPTLSTIADNVMSSHPGRAAMFALWLAFGWALFVRSRAARQ
jgi:hypothetical protein